MLRGNTLNKGKLAIVVVIVMILQMFAFSSIMVYAADYSIGSDGTVNYRLVYDSNLLGHKLQIDNSGTVEWLSTGGSVGLRTVNTSNVVSSWTYRGYSSVTAETGGYAASVNMTSANGSVIGVIDHYKMNNGALEITRNITVTTANTSDKGFQLCMPVRTATAINPTSLKWFVPSTWYGNDSDNFTSGSKMAFNGTEAAVADDSIGIPMIFNFNTTTNRGLNITDITEGRKETIYADVDPQTTKILTDDRIHLPGVGMRNVSGYTEVFQDFPGHTYNYRNAYTGQPTIYRFTPITLNNSKTTKIRITYKPYSNFNTALKTAWRDNYSRFAAVDKRFDSQTHFNNLLYYMDASYGVVGGRPQYCTNYDHFAPESGLLWKNTELAWIMLAQG